MFHRRCHQMLNVGVKWRLHCCHSKYATVGVATILLSEEMQNLIKFIANYAFCFALGRIINIPNKHTQDVRSVAPNYALL